MTRKLVLLPLLTVAVVLLATACGGYGGDEKSSSESEGGTTTIAGKAASDHGTTDVSNETGKVEVEMYDYYFEPTVLKGKPGQKITIELKNEGKVEHNFSITDQSVDQDVEAGDEAEVDVTIPKSGTTAFFCKYHESQGMSGGLSSGSGGGDGDMGSSGTSTSSGY